MPRAKKHNSVWTIKPDAKNMQLTTLVRRLDHRLKNLYKMHYDIA